uniref:Uncharacterized protein n=1 Tax=Graphocephala atropunctata TaxID=36148 RepID=A0A1B6MDH5_9HEMI
MFSLIYIFMSKVQSGCVLLGSTFTKWDVMEEDDQAEERDPFRRFNKCSKRKLEYDSETSVLVKRAKFQSFDDFVPDDARQFGADVAFRMSNLVSDYSKCFARANIHRVLLEAETYERSQRPSAPPWPLDPPEWPPFDNRSVSSDKTVSTVLADEIYPIVPRTPPTIPPLCDTSSEQCIEKEDHPYTMPFICKLS